MIRTFEKTLYIAKGGKHELTVKYQRVPETHEDKIMSVSGSVNQSNKQEDEDQKTFAYRTIRDLYQRELQGYFENLVILTGAGASTGIGLGEKKGLLTKEFWPIINDFLDNEFTTKNSLATICTSVDYQGNEADIEALLSWLFLLQQLDPKSERKITFVPKVEPIEITTISKFIESKIPFQPPKRLDTN